MEQAQQQAPQGSRAVDVTIQSSRGPWPGKTINLNLHGAKVMSAAQSVSLPLGTIVQLRVTRPNGDPPLSLPARVVETSSDSVSVSFFNLRDQQAQGLKDLLDSFLQQERQGVLPPQLGSDRSLKSEDVPPPSSLPPECVEDTRSAEQGIRPHKAGRPEAAKEGQRGESAEQPVPLTESEQTRWKELLSQVGLDSLHLPANGVLSPQWRTFLEQLGPNNSGSSTGSRSSQFRRAKASDAPTSRGNSSLTSRQ